MPYEDRKNNEMSEGKARETEESKREKARIRTSPGDANGNKRKVFEKEWRYEI